MNDAILKTAELTKEFEGLVAVDDVSIEFEQDALHAIIGPNGAGKTTFFNLLTGSLEPTKGRIIFNGEDITGLGPSEIVHLGIARSFQTANLFDELTVLENVSIATQVEHNSYNFWQSTDDLPEVTKHAQETLDRVGLRYKEASVAENLSHGEQRTLEIAIALGTDPEMLLLDEPTSGMSPEETQDIIDLVNQIADEIPIVLIEHKMSVVMEVADRIIVLHNGKKLADGPPSEVQTDTQVQEVYLGGQ